MSKKKSVYKDKVIKSVEGFGFGFKPIALTTSNPFNTPVMKSINKTIGAAAKLSIARNKELSNPNDSSAKKQEKEQKRKLKEAQEQQEKLIQEQKAKRKRRREEKSTI